MPKTPGQRPERRPPAEPMPGWPVEPTAVLRGGQALTPLEGRRQMEWAPEPNGNWVEAPRYLPPPMPLPAEQPRRGMDPLAQRLVAGGVLAAGAGVGGWFLFSAIAAALPGLVLIVVVVLLCAGGGKKGGDTINVTNNNRGRGRSTTRIN